MRHYQHFGLEGPLFRITSPMQPLYMSAAHREAFAALQWGLGYEPSGFTLLTGDPGTGKTTLLLSLLARGHSQVRTATLSNPKLGFDELLRELLRQFGIGAGPSKLEMLDALDGFLGVVEPGGRAVIIIDEAQALSDATLEEFRLLSNRGAIEEKQLQFIFVGQPELARRLREPSLRQLNERIGARAVLTPMSRAEAFGYVEYWMRSGGCSARKVFGRRALARIVDHSGGLPRRLNVLCHNAMLVAYAAGRRTVNLDAARTAAAEYATFRASAPTLAGASAVREPWWQWPFMQWSSPATTPAKPAVGAYLGEKASGSTPTAI